MDTFLQSIGKTVMQDDRIAKMRLEIAGKGEVFDLRKASVLDLSTGTAVQLAGGASADDAGAVSIAEVVKQVLDHARQMTGAIAMTTEEVIRVLQSDPTFVFRTTALLAKEQVLRGMPPTLAPLVEKGLVPVIRVACLTLDAKKTMEVMKDPDASTTDKAMSAAHLATDVAGVAGALLFIIPSATTVGSYLVAASLVGDVASFGYDVVKHYAAKKEAEPPNGNAHGGQPIPAS
jgi:hypothetical protein